MNNLQLAQKVKSIIDNYLDDQSSIRRLHEIKDIPPGIHGHLADLLFVDKVKNEMFVDLIIALITHKERTDEEIMFLLKDLQGALSSMINAIIQYEQEQKNEI